MTFLRLGNLTTPLAVCNCVFVNCVACDKATAEVRASIRWQNFVIPIVIVIAFIAAIASVRYYLRDLTEIALLEKAEADRRLKPPAPERRRQSVIQVAKERYRRQSVVVLSRFEQFKNRFKRKPKKNAKILFGVELEPPSRPFPIKPGKFKIFIGFFQIFGNFRDSFVIKWSPDIQRVMSISQQFNLVSLCRRRHVCDNIVHMRWTMSCSNDTCLHICIGIPVYHCRIFLGPRGDRWHRLCDLD